MLSLARSLLKILHPEGIPWPGTAFYNKVSETDLFQRHYESFEKLNRFRIMTFL